MKYIIKYNNIARVIYFLFLFSLLIMLINELNKFMHINAFRHDDITILNFDQYLNDPFIHQGRWLNLIFYNLVTTINSHLSIILIFIFSFYFFYKCANKITDTKNSVVIALALLQIPAFYQFLLWPIIPLSSFLILALSAYIHRYLTPFLFFIIFGVLFNGGFNNLYFLLPLLFMDFLRGNNISYIKLLIYWILGFIIGHIFSQFTVFLYSGNFIEFEPWRQAKFALSFNQLMDNIQTVYTWFMNDIRWLGLPLYLFLIPIVSLIIYKFYTPARVYTNTFILYFFIAISLYAMAIPHGLKIEIRTAFPLYATMIFLTAININRFQILTMLLTFILISNFYIYNLNSVHSYMVVDSVYYSQLKIISVNPKMYNLYFLSTSNQLQEVEKNWLR